MKIKSIEEIIEKYPKIFVDYEGNPERVNWSCPIGWLDTLDDLCNCMQNRLDNQITCIQVKEKFGGLRFYMGHLDTDGYAMIDFADFICLDTCVNCGSRDGVKMKTGWIEPLCKTCMDDYNSKRTGSGETVSNG